jgi:DNA-binding NarL/FixJ family response regulator
VFDPEATEVRTKDRSVWAHRLSPTSHLDLREILAAFIFDNRTGREAIPPSVGRTGVLVVDDEWPLQSGLTKLIRQWFPELEVHGCSNGADALTVCQAHPIGFVITDERMPGMDGIQLTRRLVQSHPDLLVLLYTGYGSPEVFDSFYDSGGCMVVQKMDSDDLRTINRAISLALCEWVARYLKAASRVTERPGLALTMLQNAAKLTCLILNSSPNIPEVARSLIQHKAKHLINDCLDSVAAGQSLLSGLSRLTERLTYLSDLSRVASRATRSSYSYGLT